MSPDGAVTWSREVYVAACRANSVHSAFPESVSVMVKSSTSLSGSRPEVDEPETFLPPLQPWRSAATANPASSRMAVERTGLGAARAMGGDP